MFRSTADLMMRGQRQSVASRKFTSITPREEGQALVEAALVLPLILTAGTGILVFGIFMMQILSLTEGVGNAGRLLAVSGGVTLDPCATAATAIQNAAPLLKTSNLTYQITLNPGTGDVVYSGSSCPSTSTTSGAAGNLVSGGTAKVKAIYSNCSLSFYGNKLAPGGCSISQTVMETVQ